MIMDPLLKKIGRMDLSFRLHVEAQKHKDSKEAGLSEEWVLLCKEATDAVREALPSIEEISGVYYYIWRNAEGDPPLSSLGAVGRSLVATGLDKGLVSPENCGCEGCKSRRGSITKE